MAEATTATSPKMKSKPASSAFEMPKFEMPKFDIPKVEMPAAFREFAERGVAQAKDTYEKMKAVAEEATDVLETTYSTASKGASDYGMKMIEAARVNTNAAFDYAGELLARKDAVGSHGAVEHACAQAVRGVHPAEQGTRRAGAEGCDRHRRADQERHEQGVRQGRLTGADPADASTAIRVRQARVSARAFACAQGSSGRAIFRPARPRHRFGTPRRRALPNLRLAHRFCALAPARNRACSCSSVG